MKRSGKPLHERYWIRLSDAPEYLSIDKNRFNSEVRPYLAERHFGKQTIVFKRLDIEAWADEDMRCNGRPGLPYDGGTTWDKKERLGSSNATVSGISTSRSTGDVFAKAVAQATEEKQKSA